MNKRLGIRWTMGDVSDHGFEALRCSIWGAYRLFGGQADYAVVVNSLRVEEVEARTRPLPARVTWVEANRSSLPAWLTPHLAPNLAEGAAWKFAPLRVFDDAWELSLDNDCVLWSIPDGMRRWLDARAPSALVAEDVRACFGQFEGRCGAAPRNLGIRGLPPGFDLAAALKQVLREVPVVLASELDEQGLQYAALLTLGEVHVVSVEDVTICSPFPPHVRHLGRSGAHFCGLNAKRLPFTLEGRPGEAHVQEHWLRHRAEVLRRTGAPPPALCA